MLSILSNIFEKHVYDGLSNHLKENCLLYKLQSGFRKPHSTETALIRVIDQLLLDLDRNRVSGLKFVDYKKAFDIVDHKILLAKLEAYGIETRDLDLVRTYLRPRSHGTGSVWSRHLVRSYLLLPLFYDTL